MKKDVNFNIVQGFCIFVQFSAFKNTWGKLPKWTFYVVCFHQAMHYAKEKYNDQKK
jgi:hypothetical protein